MPPQSAHPVLEAPNSAFPKGRYRAELEQDPNQPLTFTVRHQVRNARLVDSLIEAGQAHYLTVLSCPVSAYRESFPSDTAIQRIAGDPGNFGQSPSIVAMVVCRSKVSVTLSSEAHDVGADWDGRTLTLESGARLATRKVSGTPIGPLSGTGTHRELADGAFAAARQALIEVKGNDRQRRFLAHTRSTEDFLDYWSDIPVMIGRQVGQVAVSGEADLAVPSRTTEASLYETWADIPPAVACRPSFWGCVTLDHVRSGALQSSWLASTDRATGAVRIAQVLGENARSRKSDLAIDNTVRTVLRRMSGLPDSKARGIRSVYVNCPFARAWWRERFVRQARTYHGIDNAGAIRKLLRTNQEYFETFVTRFVSSRSTFNADKIAPLADIRVRSFFLSRMARASADASPPIRAKHLKAACDRLATQQAGRELSALSDSELDRQLQAIIRQ